MFGGVAKKSNRYATIKDATVFFLANCTLKILSNDTVSCITFIAKLNEGVESPFIHVRRSLFENPVNIMLLKYFPVNPDSTTEVGWLDIPRRSHDHQGIELATKTSVLKEFNIQINVYKKSFNTHDNVLDPLCPCPIFCFTKKTQNSLNDVLTKPNYLTPRAGKTIAQEISVIRTIFDNPRITHTYIIGMEFMEGFRDYYNIVPTLSANRQNFFCSLARFELDRLHQLKVSHGDFHQRNIMVNPTYKYLTQSNQNFLGRALIIDFGFSKEHPPGTSDTVVKRGEFYPPPNNHMNQSMWAQYTDHDIKNNIIERLKLASQTTIEYVFDLFMDRDVVPSLPQNIYGGSKIDDTFTIEHIFNNKTFDEIVNLVIGQRKFLDQLQDEVNHSIQNIDSDDTPRHTIYIKDQNFKKINTKSNTSNRMLKKRSSVLKLRTGILPRQTTQRNRHLHKNSILGESMHLRTAVSGQ
jgi:hypothetical protein